MRRGNGIDGSHSDEGRSSRGKGEGVKGAEVENERADGIELNVGVMGVTLPVPVADEERERLEEEVGNDSFRGMAKAVMVGDGDVGDDSSRERVKVGDWKWRG